MLEIFNEKPKSFFSEEPVVIYDVNENLFYFHPNKEKSILFNLPSGKFFSLNTIYKQKNFIPYFHKKGKLPKNFNEYKIFFGENLNKASIFFADKKILIDKKILHINYQPLLTFILLHELSHLLPESKKLKGIDKEKFCDNNAINIMLSIGYNPTQISFCGKISLDNQLRCEAIINNSIKINKRR